MAYYVKQASGAQWKDVKYKFRQLPLYYKLVGIGSLVALVSVFLPWVSYDTKVINGTQDITFLIGYIIFLCSLMLLVFSIIHLFEKRLPRMVMKEYTLSMFAGLQITLLSILAFSIYSKLFLFTSTSEIRFGLTSTVIGGVLICIGSYFHWKEERLEAVKKTFMQVPEPAAGKDLEKFFKKSKADHKLMSAEESVVTEAPQEAASATEAESPLPPNLKMF